MTSRRNANPEPRGDRMQRHAMVLATVAAVLAASLGSAAAPRENGAESERRHETVSSTKAGAPPITVAGAFVDAGSAADAKPRVEDAASRGDAQASDAAQSDAAQSDAAHPEAPAATPEHVPASAAAPASDAGVFVLVGADTPASNSSAAADAGVEPATASNSREQGVTVHADRAPPSRGPSDFYQVIGGLRHVPVNSASELLGHLAPGMLLTNESGAGHAEQVYLRGFDAREGQDLEFTVDGVPINEAGNPHGEGYADTHFIIPELVHAIRVIEGPFDPHQGNYAVAGSADYQLGLDGRGLTSQYTFGSFNTHRVLALWGPEGGRRGTFAGTDLRSTDGYGANRAAQLARAMGQYEFLLGGHTVVRLLATGYATRYSSAGLIRQDDYEAGRIDFFGTYDPTQGGDASRFTVAGTIEDDQPSRVLRAQVFVTQRALRIRANYTGFVHDPPAMYRTGTTQRGDLSDQSETAFTVGSRGSVRLRQPFLGHTQAFEVGYYARHDEVDATLKRNRFGTDIPYRIDSDLQQSITNIGLYADAELRPLRWITLRGGVRGDYFLYDVLDRCALHDTALNTGMPVVDMLCYTRDRSGPRDPTTRRSAGGLAVQPRGTLVIGPFDGVSISASAGVGSRAADPSYLGDRTVAPFATINATEAGLIFNRRIGALSVNARALYYYTHASRDLVFNQQAGRNTLAPGTRRQGALFAARVTAPWFDLSASATFADARFDRQAMDPGSTYFPPDSGDRVPYVPQWVVRVDGALYGEIPRLQFLGDTFLARGAVGFSYISPRALLYGERGDPVVLLDASVGVRWRWVELGFIAQNLLDRRYRIGEYNYVSEFDQTAVSPDLIAARQFSAGPPFSGFVTLTLHFATTGGERANP